MVNNPGDSSRLRGTSTAIRLCVNSIPICFWTVTNHTVDSGDCEAVKVGRIGVLVTDGRVYQLFLVLRHSRVHSLDVAVVQLHTTRDGRKEVLRTLRQAHLDTRKNHVLLCDSVTERTRRRRVGHVRSCAILSRDQRRTLEAWIDTV